MQAVRPHNEAEAGRASEELLEEESWFAERVGAADAPSHCGVVDDVVRAGRGDDRWA